MSRVAIITGAGRGIGRAVALRLAADRLDLALIYAANREAAESARDEALALGVRAECYQCDVADYSQCASTTARITAELGAPCVLINNAGMTRDGLAARMSEADFDRVIAVDLKGAFNMIRHCCRTLMRASEGRIINISSVAGLCGSAGQANYCSAKAGLIGLTKSIARELAPRGVTCNAIAPGMITTDMTGVLSEELKQKYIGTIPLGRAGAPGDIAEAAAFLASPRAAYITGVVLPVDGGMSM